MKSLSLFFLRLFLSILLTLLCIVFRFVLLPSFRLRDLFSTLLADINECLDFNLHKCDHNCTNTAGSHQCSCLLGYRLVNNTKCVDIDECQEKTDNCHVYATCFNRIGSFSCSCNAGYTGSGVYCKGLSINLLYLKFAYWYKVCYCIGMFVYAFSLSKICIA